MKGRTSKKVVQALSVGALCAVAAVQAGAPEARACGAFFRPQEMKQAPSLALERVLILHDPETRTEHFIREVVFRGGQSTFGFVVPTPTRPEVFKVKDAPFDKLDTAFPFAPPQRSASAAGSGAPGSAPRGGAPPVIILDIKKVGSFTAFILKATDATALGKWLQDNKLGTTPENDEWLAEYVKRDFYYVAFRYEPGKDQQGDKLNTETVRISFKTPVAYYPYREPRHTTPADPLGRAVALWVATPEAVVPVARTTDGGREAWVRPFQAGMEWKGTLGSTLKVYLGDDEDKLVGDDAKLVVQTFEDQKTARPGYGDVLFLPLAGVPAAAREDAKKLVSSLLAGGSK